MLHWLANPARFQRLADRLLPGTAGAAGALLLAGLYFALVTSPADYQQGETVRIMYVHVPAAWMALFAYMVLATAGGVGLVWRYPLAFLAARATAPIGASFTFLALATGSLWGEPMWGTWWAWDARLTSVLVLFFLYVGYIVLVNAFDDPGRGERAGAILALVGVVNIPIIKWSVDWWNTLHQPASITRLGTPAIHPEMLVPLLLMAGGYMALFAAVLLVRLKAEILARRVQVAAANRARAGAR